MINPNPASPVQPPTSPTSPGKSPVTDISSNTMNFPAAMRAVINGAAVTRMEWPDTGKYDGKGSKQYVLIRIFENGLYILLEDGQYHPWIVSYGDLLGEDWIIV